jgi:hypothetical protein
MVLNPKVNISRMKGEYTVTVTDVYPADEEIEQALKRISFVFNEVRKAS